MRNRWGHCPKERSHCYSYKWIRLRFLDSKKFHILGSWIRKSVITYQLWLHTDTRRTRSKCTHMNCCCCWTAPPEAQREGSSWCPASVWCPCGTGSCSDPHTRHRSGSLPGHIYYIYMDENLWLSSISARRLDTEDVISRISEDVPLRHVPVRIPTNDE